MNAATRNSGIAAVCQGKYRTKQTTTGSCELTFSGKIIAINNPRSWVCIGIKSHLWHRPYRSPFGTPSHYDPMPSSVSWGLTLFFLFFAARWLFRRRAQVSLLYPPGPKPLPLIGNLRDIPTSRGWLTYQKWSNEYSSMSKYFPRIGHIQHLRVPYRNNSGYR